MVPKSIIIAYIMRDELEFLQEGHAWQQRPQAALPQQHANYKRRDSLIVIFHTEYGNPKKK